MTNQTLNLLKVKTVENKKPKWSEEKKKFVTKRYSDGGVLFLTVQTNG